MPSFLPLRWAKKPSRQLLWLWLERDMRNLSGETGLDAACGFMENKPFFNTQHYIGIDLDRDRVNRGMKKHPDAIGEVLRIEDLDHRHQADVVLCVQTIGTNIHFVQANAREAVKKLVEATRHGGTLILNIGAKCSQKGITEELQRSFEHIEIRRYGRRIRAVPRPLSLAIAHLMNVFPALRGSRKLYCICRGRK